MKTESPKRSALDWLNRIEYRLRQFRKNDASSSDVLTYTESINTIKRILRTFRKHHSRRANKQYTKPLESSFGARTVQYAKPNLAERRNGVKRAA